MKRIGIFLLCSILAWCSCQDNLKPDIKPSGNGITFSVNYEGAWSVPKGRSTQSSVRQQRLFIGTIGRDSLFITLTEEDIHPTTKAIPTDQPGTRAVYTEETFTSFKVSAYTADGKVWSNWGTNIPVTKEGDDWNYTVNDYTEVYWPEHPLYFFAYAQNIGSGFSPNFSLTDGVCSGSFSYTLPTAQATGQATPANDAKQQPDLVVAIAPNQTKADNPVNLPFSHALSAVVFKWGTLPADLVISNASISLVGVPSSGSCTLQYSNDIAFSWETNNTTGTYTIENFLGKGSDDETFLMIPHTLSETEEMKLVFKVGEETHPFELPLPEFSTINQWEANKRYTYTISVSEDVKVEIEEDFTPETPVKSNVLIQNTGMSTAYIRAAVVGYWENSNGKIIKEWNIDDAGSGEWVKNANWNTHWTKHTDGFYYHKTPVPAGAYTQVPLFDKYELTSIGPEKDAKLIVNIVVQAVAVDLVTTAWPDAPITSNNNP